MERHLDYSSLIEKIRTCAYEAVVIEGFDGVGKGKLIAAIKDNIKCGGVYRPNYDFWIAHNLPVSLRWAISASYWDIVTSTQTNPDRLIIFDRGVMSGAVYNDEENLAKDYADLIKDRRILHVLVVCTEEDYQKFNSVRGVSGDSYDTYLEYTKRYINYFRDAEIEYDIFVNTFDKTYADLAACTCEGCGHYDSSNHYCNNPNIKDYIVPSSNRCEFSKEREIQDEQLYSLSSC